MQRAPSALRALAVLPALAALVFSAAGCGKTVAEDDCVKVRDKIRSIWDSESKREAPGPAADKAAGVIKAEGERLSTDWMAECKKDLVGRRADPKEIDCLLASKTVAEVGKCAEP